MKQLLFSILITIIICVGCGDEGVISDITNPAVAAAPTAPDIPNNCPAALYKSIDHMRYLNGGKFKMGGLPFKNDLKPTPEITLDLGCFWISTSVFISIVIETTVFGSLKSARYPFANDSAHAVCSGPSGTHKSSSCLPNAAIDASSLSGIPDHCHNVS